MKVARDRKKWLTAVASYTLAGVLTSSVVGALLGLFGQALPAAPSAFAGPLLAAIALLFAAREVGWISFPLPYRKRQTEKIWYQRFGAIRASILWGLHLGITLTTRIRFSGYWILVAVAVLAADPWSGALLCSSYWLGRTLSVWLAPLLTDDSWRGTELLDLAGDERVQARVHAGALIWAALLILAGSVV